MRTPDVGETKNLDPEISSTDGAKPVAPKPTRTTKDALALSVIADAEKQTPKKRSASILESAFKLGLSRSNWSQARLRAIAEFGDACDVRFVYTAIQAGSFNILERIEKTIVNLRRIVTDKSVATDVRVEATRALAAQAAVWQQIGRHCIEVAKLMSPKEATKPRNLPPTMPVQINVSGQKADVTISQQRNGGPGSELTPPKSPA